MYPLLLTEDWNEQLLVLFMPVLPNLRPVLELLTLHLYLELEVKLVLYHVGLLLKLNLAHLLEPL